VRAAVGEQRRRRQVEWHAQPRAEAGGAERAFAGERRGRMQEEQRVQPRVERRWLRQEEQRAAAGGAARAGRAALAQDFYFFSREIWGFSCSDSLNVVVVD
jgi:hypothetical protein